MPKFSERSLQQLNTCCHELQDICNEAIKEMDFTVICGHRGEKEQNEAFERGASKLKYPNSKHNTNPSIAVDIAPYPIKWTDKKRFIELSKIMKRIAKEKNIELVWGGDWKMQDLVHFEIKKT
jgi:peptidoglycan LD-endopeptidase CwlK